MDHSEAVRQMAAERYLLKEMPSAEREAFEEHLFECSECALDLRCGAAFMESAKAQLPELAGVQLTPVPSTTRKTAAKQKWWRNWFRPILVTPAFATLLVILGYQNFVTYPALRAAASQPRLLPWTPLHGATRGGSHQTVTADRRHGVALPVDLSPQPSPGAYVSYAFDLYDPQGKLVWTGFPAAPAGDAEDSQRLSLAIPGVMLRNGTYTLAISGVAAHCERAEIDRYVFDLRLTD
jgi:hypothetical protein